MFDVKALIKSSAMQDFCDRLKEHLSGRITAAGPAEVRSPEYDIIDAGRVVPYTKHELAVLSNALAMLMRDCELQLPSRPPPELVALVGRIGFLCSSLELTVEPQRFFRFAMFLKLSSDLGALVNIDDFFLVLRGMGRLYTAPENAPERRSFWSGLLSAPHRGVRTLAAQNLVRLDPQQALLDVNQLFDAGVNEALVAFEFFKAMNLEEFVVLSCGLLSLPTLQRLRQALVEVGEPEVAVAIHDHLRASPDAGRMEYVIDQIELTPSQILQRIGSRERFLNGFRRARRIKIASRFMDMGIEAKASDTIAEICHSNVTQHLPSLERAG